MTDTDNNKTIDIEEAFKLLSGAEKKFVNAYIENSFDKIEAVKSTLRPDKKYHQDHYRRKASVFFRRDSVKLYLDLYFKELKEEHSAKVTKLLNYLEEQIYTPETEDTNTNLKYKSLDILSKYLLELDKKGSSVSVTDSTTGQVIRVEYV